MSTFLYILCLKLSYLKKKWSFIWQVFLAGLSIMVCHGAWCCGSVLVCACCVCQCVQSSEPQYNSGTTNQLQSTAAACSYVTAEIRRCGLPHFTHSRGLAMFTFIFKWAVYLCFFRDEQIWIICVVRHILKIMLRNMRNKSVKSYCEKI